MFSIRICSFSCEKLPTVSDYSTNLQKHFRMSSMNVAIVVHTLNVCIFVIII